MVNLWFSWLLRMSTGCFVCGSVLQRVAAWCSVMQRVAEFGCQLTLENVYWGSVCCIVLQCVEEFMGELTMENVCWDFVCCSVLQCVAICCSVL